MKKKIFLLLLVAAILLPISTLAKTYYDEYKTMNLKEALAQEEIELQNKDYKENDKQAIIYLFRGNGCGYCRAFLTFLSSISKEYGDYFRVVSFEVWQDSKNSALMNKVASVTNKPAGGVPYIIIGDKVFGGYAAAYDEDIKAAIMAQYKDSSYDVFKELEKKEKAANGGTSTFAVVFWNAAIVIAATVAIIMVSNKNTQRVLDALDDKSTKKNK